MAVCSLLLAGAAALAQTAPAPASEALPIPVLQALRQAEIPPEALAVYIAPLDAGQPRLAWQAQRPMNPASLFKLATSLAALELLGPQHVWRTPVWLQGTLDRDSGELQGDLLIKGVGDPKLVQERVWLLLQRVRQLGVRSIRGDIVLDNSLYVPSDSDPADFDGEPWRPGNAQPEALLLNFKSQILQFRPDPARRLAWVDSDLPLPLAQTSVPLAAGPCGDWRGQLKLQWRAGEALQFGGSYPASCGEQRWPLADPQPSSFNARLIQALWQGSGGTLQGRVRPGLAPATAPSLWFDSPPLAELLRDINKHSSNLMAEMLMLALATAPGQTGPVDAAAGRAALRAWLKARLGSEDFVVERGSGLSRLNRLSAAQLALLLRQGFEAPLMPEFLASLPLAGVDGTLARARLGPVQGRAHLKTGTLRDAAALAGYVLGADGRRHVLVAIINHPRAPAGRAALEALVRWAAQPPLGAE